MLMPLEGTPFFLHLRVGDQNALLLRQNAMEERGLVREQTSGESGDWAFSAVQEKSFLQGRAYAGRFGHQHPSARVRN